MKSIWVICALLVGYICALGMAAPAPEPAPAEQKVQFIKYKNDKDLEEIQRQIIAQYENLGGSSQFHQVQSSAFVDPHNLKIQLK